MVPYRTTRLARMSFRSGNRGRGDAGSGEANPSQDAQTYLTTRRAPRPRSMQADLRPQPRIGTMCGLVFFGATLALAGCATTTSDRGENAGTASSTASAPPAPTPAEHTGTRAVFEATGLAYFGGLQYFDTARQRAYDESIWRVFLSGAQIHLSRVKITKFKILTTDCAMQVARGSLKELEVIEEGIDRKEARYFVKVRASFERHRADTNLEESALQKSGCWHDDETATASVTEPEPVAQVEAETEAVEAPNVEVQAPVTPVVADRAPAARAQAETEAVEAPNVEVQAPVTPVVADRTPAARAKAETEAVEASAADVRGTENAASEATPKVGRVAAFAAGAETQLAGSASSRAATSAPASMANIPVSEMSVMVCCHGFPDHLSRRLQPALDRFEGITGLEELSTRGDSLCYRFRYEGALSELERRLKDDVRTSSSTKFRVNRGACGPNVIDLVFDGGFDGGPANWSCAEPAGSSPG